MTDTPKITRPCPWCNGNDVQGGDYEYVPGFTVWYVYCEKCRCRGPGTTNQKDAVSLWNDDAGRDERQKKASGLIVDLVDAAVAAHENRHRDIVFAQNCALLARLRADLLGLIR